MSQISVTDLSFAYEGSHDNIFEHVSFTIDTDWKLGFIGRNGRGKTTFLRLLMGQHEYRGSIAADVAFDYFPFAPDDVQRSALAVARGVIGPFDELERTMQQLIDDGHADDPAFGEALEAYQALDGYVIDELIEREVGRLGVDAGALDRPFDTLSNGEQTKVLLASLFLKKNNFLLLDEPTNHLDTEGRATVQRYLAEKKGFILASHDRALLDAVCDHILSINRATIEVQKGNFTSWKHNRDATDAFERARNEDLKRDISRLQTAARRTSGWSDAVESTKTGTRNSGLRPDRGFIGHKAAKMMQRAKSIESRQQKAIEEKSTLLKDLEEVEAIRFNAQQHHAQRYVLAQELQVVYDHPLFAPLSFELMAGERVFLRGANGSGKSSILRLLMGEDVPHTGRIALASGLVVSYIPQDTSKLRGDLREFARASGVDESLLLAMLRKLDFERVQFTKDLSELSSGQKKKVLLAKSLLEPAHLYIWDEPLNFVDLFSRMQIEQAIERSQPTMLVIEHDAAFVDNAATKVIDLSIDI